MTIPVIVVSLEKVVYEDTAEEIIAPTENGQIAILPHHIPLLTTLTEGEVIIKKGGKDTYIAITGGFLDVSKEKTTILADYAIESEDIQVAKAQQAKEKAEKLLEEKVGNFDFAEIEAQLRRSLLELKIGQKRKAKILR